MGIFASPFFDLAAFALPFFGAEFEIEADTTVRHRGMETGISEASKRVSIFSFATQGGKQESFYF
jgi:hypothetical protein